MGNSSSRDSGCFPWRRRATSIGYGMSKKRAEYGATKRKTGRGNHSEYSGHAGGFFSNTSGGHHGGHHGGHCGGGGGGDGGGCGGDSGGGDGGGGGGD
ncbi:hypothetical protein IW148_003596 [Coemansia sp. RSA 1199]|nr:hypothetical protein IW148_003596 [Coemansia sp. RSA 1199]